MKFWPVLFSGSLAFASLLPLSPAAAQAAQYQWAKATYNDPASGTSATSAASRAVAVADDGSVYTAFSYDGAMVIDGASPPFPYGYYQGILKRDAQGNVVWKKLLTGLSVVVSDLKLDDAGNVVLVGTFRGTLTIDNQNFSLTGSNGGNGAFVAKFDPVGTLLWAQTPAAGGVLPNNAPAQITLTQVAVDGGGNVYVMGSAGRQAVFGPTAQLGSPILSTNRIEGALFCAKYTYTGDLVWVKGSSNHGTAGSGGSEAEGTGLGVDDAGNVYLTGRLPETLTWDGGGTIGTARSGNSVFWLKLDRDGVFISGFGVRTTGTMVPVLAVAPDGTSYLGQNFEELLSPLNGVPVTAPTVANTLQVLLARLAPDGTPQWTRTLASGRTFESVFLKDVAIDRLGSVYFGGAYNGDSLVIDGVGPLPATSGAAGFNTDGLIGALDQATGQPQWALPAGDGPWMELVTSVGVGSYGDLAVAGSFNSDSARFAPFTVRAPSNNNLFTAKLNRVYNYLMGNAFFDENANGQRDSTEQTVPAGTIIGATPDGPFAVTNFSGDYAMQVGLGTFEPAPTTAFPYYTVAGGGSFTLSQYGNTVNNIRIALQPVLGRPNVRLAVTTQTAPRPGFPLKYRVTYRNEGTTVASGTVNFTYDQRLSYVGTTVPVTANGRTLTATYVNLRPGQQQDFDVVFQVSTLTPIGQTISSSAVISLANDQVPADNAETVTAPAVRTAPGNSLAVNLDQLSVQQVQAGAWLEYTVQFQNDGAATAANVSVMNQLPTALLYVGSLQVVSSSHNCTWSLSPSGRLTISFPGIQLPSSAVNTTGSNGFVRFRVRPRATLVAGTQITTLAQVHFDAAHVSTNPALTTVQSVLGVATLATPAASLEAWPNPVQDELRVTLPSTPAPATLMLIDVTGRTVRTLTTSATEVVVDVRGLPAGLYTLRAGTATRRIVVQ